MNPRRKKGLVQVIVGVVVLLVALFLYWYGKTSVVAVGSFVECAAAGNPVMESYPRQCRTSDGRVFKEDIGNELEKDNLIRISEPRPNATVKSPLTVRGMARGNWFFKASFPIKLLDTTGTEVAHTIAQAKSDWMTVEFVPFEAVLTFTVSAGSGILVLEKDNPSGLPEHDDELRVPVRFKK